MTTQNYTEILNEHTIPKEGLNLQDRYPPDKFIVAYPGKVITFIPKGFQLVPRIIKLSPDVADKDVYNTPKKSGFLSISSQGALKLEKLVCIDWLYSRHERERDPQTRSLLSIKCDVFGRWMDYTGKVTDITASASEDFTALKEAGSYSADDIRSRKINGDERTETKAKRRAVLMALNITASMLKEEFKKRFVAFTMQVILDPDNPIDRLVMLNRGSEAQRLLYGGSQEPNHISNSTTYVENADAEIVEDNPAAKAETKKPPDQNSSSKSELIAKIKTAAEKTGKKLPGDLESMTEPSLKGLLININQEADRVR
jgi:hypothetical protein